MYILLNFFINMNEEKYYLALLHKIWISHKKLHIIFNYNCNYKSFYDNLSWNSLLKYWFTENQINFILNNKNNIKLDKVINILKQRKVSIVTVKDNDFPDSLKQIPNIPFLIYLRWVINYSPKIAVVWTRSITSYWKDAIENIVWEVSNFFTIVSWWASWCDTKAHEIAVNHNNKTISIIWTWIDIDYPVYNKKLYDKIVEKWWWVISIFPIWEPWNPYNFPIRNEIVAWLSVWVIIIEAKEKSWSLITANLALDLWKDLYAIPWNFNRITSEWCNMLIKKWMAKLITNSNDILEEYNIKTKINSKKTIIFNDKLEEKIYNLLITENINIDQISNILWEDITHICLKLSILEINWLIKKINWWKYEIC